MSEYVFRRVLPMFCYHKHGDNNGGNPDKCPEDCRGLFVTTVIHIVIIDAIPNGAGNLLQSKGANGFQKKRQRCKAEL
jgi:hypothetical protein